MNLVHMLAILQAVGMGTLGIIGIGSGFYLIMNGFFIGSLSFIAGIFALFWGVPTSLRPPFGHGWDYYD